MRRNIYMYVAAIAIGAAAVGCLRDEVPPPTPGEEKSVDLSISLPAPVNKTMGGTRAGATDFDQLNDLNIVIARSEAETAPILSIIHLALGPDGPTTALPAGIVYSASGTGHGFHFSEDWLGYYEIPAATAAFFLVGNYGGTVDVDTVGELLDLREVSDVPGGVGTRHMMFGRSEPFDNPAHAAQHPEGRSLKIDLKRTAAMVTVKINGSALDPSVVVTPLSVSLHNVPMWCVLGRENVIDGVTPIGGAVSADGEFFTSGDLGWGSIASAGSGLGSTVSAVVGAHYTDRPDGSPGTVPDWTKPQTEVRPMFLFENLHGGDAFGAPNTAATQESKRPAGVANDEASIWSAPKTAYCSYLEVKATYYQHSGPAATTPMIRGGEVTFRVFLGENVWQNFDVTRNSYYRFTLNLSRTAISEGDSSWRLDTDLSNESVLDESDFTLNAAGEIIIINELMPKPDNSGWGVTYDPATMSQRNANGTNPYIWWVRADVNDWFEMPLDSYQYNGQDGKLFTTTPDNMMQYRLYVEPMVTTDGAAPNVGYVRRVSFYLLNNSGYESDVITITQYGPIVVNLTEDNTPQEIRDHITGVLGRGLPVTIHLDRIDRDAAPWGFDGVSVPAAGTSGAANQIALLGTTAGAGYTLFGKPSAVMHAAYINAWQMMSPGGSGIFSDPANLSPAPSIADIRAAAAAPTSPVVPNAIPSRAEWRLLEMLSEAGFEIFDERHPIQPPYFSYWTADAVEGSNALSWAYRVGNAESTHQVARTTPLRYRMIHIASAMNE